MGGFVAFIAAICMIWPVISYIYKVAKEAKRAREYQRNVRELKQFGNELAGSALNYFARYASNPIAGDNTYINFVLGFDYSKPYLVELTLKVFPALLAYICKSSGYSKKELEENVKKYENIVVNDDVLKTYDICKHYDVCRNVNMAFDAVYNNELNDNELKKRIMEFFLSHDKNREDKKDMLYSFLNSVCPFDLNLNDSFKFYLYSFFEEYGLEEREIREELLEFGVSS